MGQETTASIRKQAEPQQPPFRVANALRALVVMAIMGLVSLSVLIGRRNTASAWAGLMEASGFEDWPRVGGSEIHSIVCVVSMAVPGVAFLALCCLSVVRRSTAVCVWTLLVATAVLAAWIGAVATLIGTPGLSDASFKQLAVQSVPATTFNRGVCLAWCRHDEGALASLLKGECGDDTPTVFDDVIEGFQVGDWCKEAIARQNFDILAAYNGTSPIANLKGQTKAFPVNSDTSDGFSVVNGVITLLLLFISVSYPV